MSSELHADLLVRAGFLRDTLHEGIGSWTLSEFGARALFWTPSWSMYARAERALTVRISRACVLRSDLEDACVPCLMVSAGRLPLV